MSTVDLWSIAAKELHVVQIFEVPDLLIIKGILASR